MLKSLIAAAAALFAISLVPNIASAQDFYGKVAVGQTLNTDVGGLSLSDNSTFGIAVGANVNMFRVEVGVDRLTADISLFQAAANDYSGTVYFDYPVGDRLKLYAGVGADYVQGRAELGFAHLDGSGWGRHVTAGMSYPISNRITLEAQARVLDSDLEVDYIGSQDFTAGTATLGMRFRV